jgi:MerC mercury resistance protein
MLYSNTSADWSFSMSSASPSRSLDAAAIGLSAVCLVHCLVLPVAVAALPLLAVVADAEWVHFLVVALAAPVAVLALRRRGTPIWMRALALCGLAALVAGALEFPSHEAETPLTVVGALVLATVHASNLLRRHRAHAHTDP